MSQVSKRLSVEGPDSDGDFEVTLKPLRCGSDWTYLTREEANALIVALGGTPPSEEA